VGYSVGVHPCEDAATMARATTEFLVELAQSDKVWALGETGLIIIIVQNLLQNKKQCFARHIHASKL
jgi:TatD DNase family protein